jgi:hypothetical protein
MVFIGYGKRENMGCDYEAKKAAGGYFGEDRRVPKAVRF